MLSGVTPVPQTVVDADPIGDLLVVGSPLEIQESAASNNLADANGLGPMAAAVSYSPEYTTINGRNFGYYVPESYDPSTPTSLLFMFHGMGGNSSQQSGGSAENGYYGWQTTAHENGFIVLFPESLGFFNTWDLGAGGNSSDLSFVDDMIDWADTNYNINTSQIFTTGHSWGAYFSYYVARYRSDDITAFAAHSGGLGGAFFLGSTPPVPTGPSPTPTLNGIVLHAVDDGIVPYSNSQALYDDLLANGHNVYDDGIGADGIIEVDGWGPDNHRYRLQHNQTQWDFFLSVAPEDVPLVLNIAVADASIAEGAGTAATIGTVTRSDPRGNLTVALTSDDTSEATIPAQVAFLDGQSSVTFEIAAVDDSDVDGTQTVTLSAAAAGYTGASDTLEVSDDDVPLVLGLAVADTSIAEGAGTAATIGTVTRSDPRGNLTVALTSDDTSEATVPAQVAFLDGQSSVTFEIAAVDDSDVDGTQTVTLSAAAAGYTGASDTLEVSDDDVPLVLNIAVADASIAEGAGAAATIGTVTRSDPRGNLTVSLTSDDTSEATVPASITLNDGESTGSFPVNAIDDNQVDGAQSVTITASAEGYEGGNGTLSVTDNDVPLLLSLSFSDDSFSETYGAAATIGTVTRTDSRGDLAITLESSDTSEATVPESITLNDGESTASFPVNAIDDNQVDGDQTATISANAEGYASVSVNLAVTDDDTIVSRVIDNGDAGFTHSGFRYQSNRQVAAAYGGDNHHLRSDSGAASWNFTNLDDGEYRVSATWLHKYDNKYNSTDSPLTISNGAGTLLASTTLDQTAAPSGFLYDGVAWDDIGVVNVTDGVLTVTLSAGTNANRHTVADAILVERIGSVHPALSLTLPVAAISEAAGEETVSATVTRTDTRGDLTVYLTSSDPGEASVPESVTIFDGSDSASFDILAVNDNHLDGTQEVTIIATADSYRSGEVSINVEDDEASSVAIIDNGDAGFTHSGFRYQSNRQVAAAYGGDNHHLRSDSGAASWNFTNLDDGEYRVSATWHHKYDNKYNSTDSPLTISNGAGTLLASTTLDQTAAPSGFLYDGVSWNDVGVVNVTDGVLTVTLSAGTNANRHTVADAILVERIGEVSTTSASVTNALDEEAVDALFALL